MTSRDELVRDDDEVTEVVRHHKPLEVLGYGVFMLQVAAGFLFATVDKHHPALWPLFAVGFVSMAVATLARDRKTRFVFHHAYNTVEVTTHRKPLPSTFDTQSYANVFMGEPVVHKGKSLTTLRVGRSTWTMAVDNADDEMRALHRRLEALREEQRRQDDAVKLLAERAEGHVVPDGGAGNAGTPVAVPLFSSTNEDAK